ncbi:putative formin binding protein [Aspergillus ibericus CBS 121593]|uniref:Uncharacterized protein n=1 Tax=Aspergillus ibericus CBS 121593 TaxID=1448316 RepID=A0A395H3N8_9EURO|nr:hypothetical protein BO80DRAFT_423926 [Aspergillus ibericus CBS 121593]RAL02517.1 hypothetical protein BO80DRAFT_423926 [Aspergillus ibericus CBS 121593]
MGVAIPDEYRREMALAGEWQTVAEKVVQPQDDAKSSQSLGVRKRKHEERDEEEEAAKREAERFVSKGWGSRVRQYPGAPEDTDLDALLESTKDIKKAKPSTTKDLDPKPDPTLEKEPESAKGQFLPVKSEEDVAPEAGEPSQIKQEETEAGSSTPAIKEDPDEAPAAGVVFKKRKAKVMRK